MLDHNLLSRSFAQSVVQQTKEGRNQSHTSLSSIASSMAPIPQVSSQTKDLKQSGFTSFGDLKHIKTFSERLASQRAIKHWQNAKQKIQEITKGAFPGCSPLKESYFVEQIDPLHRHPRQVSMHFSQWSQSNITTDNFESSVYAQAPTECNPPSREAILLDDFRHWPDSESTQSLNDWKKSLNETQGVIRFHPQYLHTALKVQMIDNNRLIPSDQFPPLLNQEIRNLPPHEEIALIYVIDQDNNIFIHKKYDNKVHHSSFLDGKPVKSAGDITLNNRFNITSIGDHSGHYSPTNSYEQVVKTMKAFASQGMPMPSVSDMRSLAGSSSL